MNQIKLSTNKVGLVIRTAQIAPVTVTEEAKAYLKGHLGDLLMLHRTFGPDCAEQILEVLTQED